MLGADVFLIVFRFFHIVAGALWVGAVFLFVGFIGPSAAEVGPAAGPMLGVLVKKRNVTKVLAALGGTTVLAGWIMWIRNIHTYGGFHEWTTSHFGIGVTIGALLATFAFIDGMINVAPNIERMVDLGQETAASGGPPTPDVQQRMAQIGARARTHGTIVLFGLILAVACMATARYW
ncbi:MAG: hypothetical protein ACXVQU_11420 [Actinomycetota bacterium]